MFNLTGIHRHHLVLHLMIWFLIFLNLILNYSRQKQILVLELILIQLTTCILNYKENICKGSYYVSIDWSGSISVCGLYFLHLNVNYFLYAVLYRLVCIITQEIYIIYLFNMFITWLSYNIIIITILNLSHLHPLSTVKLKAVPMDNPLYEGKIILMLSIITVLFFYVFFTRWWKNY